jgi:leucyl aminopeptidase
VEFSIKSGSPEKQRSACVVVGIFESRKLTLPAELLDKASGGYISDIIRRGDMEGKSSSTLLLQNVPGTLCDRVLLVGLGKEKEFREKEFGVAISTTVKVLNETGAFDASIFLTELAVKKRSVGWRVRQATLLALDTTYKFDQFKSKKEEVRRPLRKLTFSVERRNELTAAETALNQGLAIAEGVAMTKTLGNLPPMSVIRPIWRNRHRQWLRSSISIAKSWIARIWKSWACTRCWPLPKARINPKIDRSELQRQQSLRKTRCSGGKRGHIRHRRNFIETRRRDG